MGLSARAREVCVFARRVSAAAARSGVFRRRIGVAFLASLYSAEGRMRFSSQRKGGGATAWMRSLTPACGARRPARRSGRSEEHYSRLKRLIQP
jgi:hypothetical protein